MQNKEIYNNAQQLKQMKSTAMDANTDTGRSPNICYHHPCLIYNQSINQYDGNYWRMRSTLTPTGQSQRPNIMPQILYLTLPYLLITLEERDTTSWRR